MYEMRLIAEVLFRWNASTQKINRFDMFGDIVLLARMNSGNFATSTLIHFKRNKISLTQHFQWRSKRNKCHFECFATDFMLKRTHTACVRAQNHSPHQLCKLWFPWKFSESQSWFAFYQLFIQVVRYKPKMLIKALMQFMQGVCCYA